MGNEVFDYIIYTDGSANSGPTGGSACIVEDTNTLERHYLVTSFLKATNNQSEIYATLIGYAFIDCLQGGQAPPWKLRVKVVSDSEHVLDCSVQHINTWIHSGKLNNDKLPLKNRGFWQMLAKFQEKVIITGQHVKGHSGHYDNERCDNAASWARKIRMEKPGFTLSCMVELIKRRKKTKTFVDNWFYFDSEPVIECLRDGDNIRLHEALSRIKDAIKSILDQGNLELITTQDRALKAMIDKVKEAVTMANKYRTKDSRISGLESKLLDVIGEYKDEHY